MRRCFTHYFIDSDEKTIRFQGAYVSELVALTDYPSFDVEAVCELFLLWEQHKHDDIMGYRNHAYRFVFVLGLLMYAVFFMSVQFFPQWKLTVCLPKYQANGLQNTHN